MTTSATMTTMVMTITVRAVFFHAQACRNGISEESNSKMTPTPWSSHTPTRTAQFSSPAMRSTLAVVCPTAKYPPSAAA